MSESFLTRGTNTLRSPGKRLIGFERGSAYCFSLFLFYFSSASLCLASPAQVRVTLLDAVSNPQKIILYGPFTIEGRRALFAPAGCYQLSAQQDGGVLLASLNQKAAPLFLHERNLRLHPASSGSIMIAHSAGAEARSNERAGTTRSRVLPRRYKGALVISTRPVLTGGYALSLINVVTRREYLASVVASEMPLGASLEALKAQSVLANTQIARLSNSQTISDSTQVQSYRGAPTSRPEAYVAVDQCADQILEYRHKPIQAFFHSTCAGMTSKPADIFGGKESLPYLTNVKCEDCRLSPFWNVTEMRIPSTKFETIFGGSLPEITACDHAGRPTTIAYRFAGKPVITNGYQFWLRLGQAFGWGKAPGTKFSLSMHDREVFIKSTGAGHGVGMCQWGAVGMARRGKTYAQILAFYFPGTALRGGTVPHRPL